MCFDIQKTMKYSIDSSHRDGAAQIYVDVCAECERIILSQLYLDCMQQVYDGIEANKLIDFLKDLHLDMRINIPEKAHQDAYLCVYRSSPARQRRIYVNILLHEQIMRESTTAHDYAKWKYFLLTKFIHETTHIVGFSLAKKSFIWNGRYYRSPKKTIDNCVMTDMGNASEKILFGGVLYLQRWLDRAAFDDPGVEQLVLLPGEDEDEIGVLLSSFPDVRSCVIEGHSLHAMGSKGYKRRGASSIKLQINFGIEDVAAATATPTSQQTKINAVALVTASDTSAGAAASSSGGKRVKSEVAAVETAPDQPAGAATRSRGKKRAKTSDASMVVVVESPLAVDAVRRSGGGWATMEPTDDEHVSLVQQNFLANLECNEDNAACF